MGIWNNMRVSYHQAGVGGDFPWNPSGQNASWNMHAKQFGLSGISRPRAGLLRSMSSGIAEFAGIDNVGQGNILGGKMLGRPAANLKYGGGLFSAGGWREITHTAKELSPGVAGGMKGIYRLGARRSATGMVGKFAGKALGPAFFAYQAATEGVGTAVKDTIMFGAAWGAGKWALSRLGMAAFNPITIGAAVLTAGIIGGRAALMAGRQYNRDIRKVSFGNAASDTYGTIATMRQASVNAIQSSRINGRSALGNEANLMHL